MLIEERKKELRITSFVMDLKENGCCVGNTIELASQGMGSALQRGFIADGYAGPLRQSIVWESLCAAGCHPSLFPDTIIAFS